MSELSKRVRAKYPGSYDHLQDNELEDKVLSKYPQYKSLTKKTVGGFVDNVGTSAVNLVKDLGHAVTHPVQTTKGMATLGVGMLDKFTPGVTHQEKMANSVGRYYGNRYGSPQKIADSAYKDPVGVGADVAAVLTGAGGLVKGGVGLATKGATATKLASNTAKLGKFGSQLSRVGAATDPLIATGRLAKSAARPLARVASKVPQIPNSKSVLTRGLGNPAKQRKMITPMDEIIPKYNLYDRTPGSAQEAINAVKSQRTTAVKQSGAFGNLQDLIKPLDDKITSMMSDPDLFRDGVPLSPEAGKRLDQLMENRTNIVRRFSQEVVSEKPPRIGRPPKGYSKTIHSTNLNPEVNVSEIDAFRRKAIDPNIPEGSFAKSMSQRPARDKAFQQTRKALKGAVDEKAGTKQMGSDMQSLIKAKDVFEGFQERAKNRQTFNFTKLGSAGVGGLMAGIPGAVGGFVVEQFVNSPRGLEIMYKAMNKLDGGAFSGTVTKTQIIKNLTTELKKVGVVDPGKAAKAIYDFARLGRMTNP